MHGTIESVFRVEWRKLSELAPIAMQWRTLAARALEPNVFYEPAFALAAQPVFGRDAGAGLVWSRSSPSRLLGFFPAYVERHRYGIALPVLVGWTHPYAPLGAPLVERDTADLVIAAWLDHVAANPELPNRLLLPYLPTDGRLADALDFAVIRGGGQTVSFGAHRRALLAPPGEHCNYLDNAIGHKKRKELRRQRKRLGDSGVVMSDSTGDPAALANALGDFLALEASGWKGRAGTAARTDPNIQKFMQSALTDLAGEGKARLARLFVDTQPVAAIVTLKSGTTAWCWKIAYDESFARFSPGVQLVLDVTQELLDTPDIAQVDSCATENHRMIDHIWRERLALADRLIRIGPEGSGAFVLARTLETLRRSAIAGAKKVRILLRR